MNINLTILGRIKRLKLKLVGLCFIFIMYTPALLPLISFKNQNSSDFIYGITNFTLFSTKIQKTSYLSPLDKDYGDNNQSDENEFPWGNGVFNNPWVICNEIQELLRINCNQILTDISILINILQND